MVVVYARLPSTYLFPQLLFLFIIPQKHAVVNLQQSFTHCLTIPLLRVVEIRILFVNLYFSTTLQHGLYPKIPKYICR